MERLFIGVVVILLAVSLAVLSTLNTKGAAFYDKRGNVWYEKGEYDKAIADYNQALRIDPHDATPTMAGVMLVLQTPVRQGHCGLQQSTADRSPLHLFLQWPWKRWYEKDNMTKPSPTITRQYGSIPRTPYAHNGRGNAWYVKREYDKAIADLTGHTGSIPIRTYSYNGRGNAWYAKHEYDKAIADYDKALEINPNDAYAHHARGSAWSNKGDYDKAIADATEAIRLNPQYPLAYGSRGWAYVKKGEHEKAIADYNKVIHLDPNRRRVQLPGPGLCEHW